MLFRSGARSLHRCGIGLLLPANPGQDPPPSPLLSLLAGSARQSPSDLGRQLPPCQGGVRRLQGVVLSPARVAAVCSRGSGRWPSTRICGLRFFESDGWVPLFWFLSRSFSVLGVFMWLLELAFGSDDCASCGWWLGGGFFWCPAASEVHR